jgi:hypothetical protein
MTMGRTVLACVGVVLMWVAALVVAIGAERATQERGPEELGFLVVAAAVVAAWKGSDLFLRRLGRELPYRPE